MTKFFKVILLCLLTISLTAVPSISLHATTIYQPDHIAKFRIEQDEGIINLQGMIDDDSAAVTQQAFDFFAKNHIRNVIIHLHSLGGKIKAGDVIIALMLNAEHHHIVVATLVDHGDYCASMATAIFAAGSSRLAADDSIWMFHSPFIPLSDEQKANPDIVAQANEFIKQDRIYMLKIYALADKRFTKDVLEEYVNDDNGKKLDVTGERLHNVSETFITFYIIG
jgi:ATP-dependent protease ClpP protease subunit